MTDYSHRNETYTVGTAAFQLMPLVQSGIREVYAVKNTSAAGQQITIQIGIGRTAVSGAGIVLNAGESWTESIETTFLPTQEPISIIANNASGSIAIYERIKKM